MSAAAATGGARREAGQRARPIAGAIVLAATVFIAAGASPDVAVAANHAWEVRTPEEAQQRHDAAERNTADHLNALGVSRDQRVRGGFALRPPHDQPLARMVSIAGTVQAAAALLARARTILQESGAADPDTRAGADRRIASARQQLQTQRREVDVSTAAAAREINGLIQRSRAFGNDRAGHHRFHTGSPGQRAAEAPAKPEPANRNQDLAFRKAALDRARTAFNDSLSGLAGHAMAFNASARAQQQRFLSEGRDERRLRRLSTRVATLRQRIANTREQIRSGEQQISDRRRAIADERSRAALDQWFRERTDEVDGLGTLQLNLEEELARTEQDLNAIRLTPGQSRHQQSVDAGMRELTAHRDREIAAHASLRARAGALLRAQRAYADAIKARIDRELAEQPNQRALPMAAQARRPAGQEAHFRLPNAARAGPERPAAQDPRFASTADTRAAAAPAARPPAPQGFRMPDRGNAGNLRRGPSSRPRGRGGRAGRAGRGRLEQMARAPERPHQAAAPQAARTYDRVHADQMAPDTGQSQQRLPALGGQPANNQAGDPRSDEGVVPPWGGAGSDPSLQYDAIGVPLAASAQRGPAPEAARERELTRAARSINRDGYALPAAGRQFR